MASIASWETGFLSAGFMFRVSIKGSEDSERHRSICFSSNCWVALEIIDSDCSRLKPLDTIASCERGFLIDADPSSEDFSLKSKC